jgi:hypothetical protein
MYCVRVVSAQILLPATLRDVQGPQQQEYFLQQRQRYLAGGSISSMSEMLSLLAYSKYIALAQGNTCYCFLVQGQGHLLPL